MVLLLEGYGGGGKGDWSVTIKRANIEKEY